MCEKKANTGFYSCDYDKNQRGYGFLSSPLWFDRIFTRTEINDIEVST